MTTRLRFSDTAVLGIALLGLAAAGVMPSAAGQDRIPLIYVTDLFHPHDDPDDHFDLATLFALPEFEILGIVAEHAEKQVTRPGTIPVRQMLHIAGQQVPCAVGLNPPLASPDDPALTQPPEAQQGVDLIIEQLRAAKGKVTLFTTGSLRDVAAAWNRDPDLLRQKVARLYMNVGNASPQESEWNVELDPHAYVRIMQSDLPLYWCPCFGAPYGTYWKFRQGDVLESAANPLQNFFLFALTTGSEWRGEPPTWPADPLAALTAQVDPAVREAVFAASRNMWCTAPFLHAAGRQVVELEPGRWVAVRPGQAIGKPVQPFDFVPARVSVDAQGRTSVREEGRLGEPHIVATFKVLDDKHYEAMLTSCLRELLRRERGADATSDGADLRLRAENLTLLPQSQPVAAVRVWNAGEQPYAGQITLQPPEAWKLTPPQHAVQLAPGEETRLTFSVENAVESPENVYPVVMRAAADGEEVAVHQEIRVATAPYFRPAIDGEWDDWKDAVPVTFRTDGQQTTICTAWHRRSFSILVAVQEDALERPEGEGPRDAVQLALAQRDAAAADAAAPLDRFEFLLVPGAADSQRGTCYCLATPGTPAHVAAEPRAVAAVPVCAAELVVRRVDRTTYYECSLPWGDMQSYLRPAEGREFNLSVLIHDPDGTGLRDWGEAAGLWESQRSELAWSKWSGARWRDQPPMDSRTRWGLCSSRY